MKKKIIYSVMGILSTGLFAGMILLWWLVAISPGEAIRPENIEKILTMESRVYYADGVHRIGVFFEKAHRQYVPFRQIPKDFVNAIVAAEDQRFFEHHGVDFLGITRAMLANIRAGRIVQGGSTITQQTAKNLFKRQDRSVRAKLRELLYAWRLEYHYPKEKILEFYANQFFVSANGRGLGIAARYYFNKSVSELTLLENAFIAGSVKRPNFYNPFIQKNEKSANTARSRAKIRTAYVLGQMYRHGFIDTPQHQKYTGMDIPFQQGLMSYGVNTILDLVRAGLAEPEVEEALSKHGIDNVAVSGIRIITTVDKDIQAHAFHALRKELSRLDVRLQGYDQQGLQEVYTDFFRGGKSEIRRGGFLVGRIAAIDKSKSPSVEIILGKDNRANTPRGRIDKAGLMNMVVPLVRYQRQRWSEAKAGDLFSLLDQLTVGDLVYVSMRDVDSINGEYLLDLEKYPELQGAVLVLRQGTIRAMVGGRNNRFFNRAVTARRSMGSAIKPLVYAAAIQLGWNSIDILNNQRHVFVYQNKPYFPRPNHKSPHRGVSMNWAGAKSENLATVWLLYHLVDHLAPSQFKQVIDHLALSRQPKESALQYQSRIRDQYGIVVNRDALHRAAFDKAVRLVEPDLLFAGKFAEHEALARFHYGANFEMFLRAKNLSLNGAQAGSLKRDEIVVRRALLKKNYLRFKQLREEVRRLTIEATETAARDNRFINLFYDSTEHIFSYGEHAPEGAAWARLDFSRLDRLMRSLDAQQQQQFWDDVYIDGVLTVATIDLLTNIMDREYERLSSLPPYSFAVLSHIRDFRVLVALRYLISFSQALGVNSALEPVLSFPLGANVITVLELARVYEGLSSGKTISSGSSEVSAGLMIIKRIEDSDGVIIYTPERDSRQILDPKVSLAVNNILRNVVKFGTGSYADKNIRLQSRDPQKTAQLQMLDLAVPTFGKTGTANRFTNATFAGIVPGVVAGGKLSLAAGHTIAAYVGFDDNRPMVRGTTRIAGSSGVLPLWSKLANAILLERDYVAEMDLVDFSFAGLSEVPLVQPDLGQIAVKVDRGYGSIMIGSNPIVKGKLSSDEAYVITFGEISAQGEMRSIRFFRPYWQTKEN